MKTLMPSLSALLLTLTFIACSSDQQQTYTQVSNNATKVEVEIPKQKVSVDKQVKTAMPKPAVTTVPAKAVIPANVAASKSVAAPIISKAEKVASTTTNTPNGRVLFQTKCLSCHGAKAEKKALNKSHIIAGWNSSRIIDALTGYQNGTYGSSMKAVMQMQAKKLSSSEIKALAEHISKL